jgi:hypothetical protein
MTPSKMHSLDKTQNQQGFTHSPAIQPHTKAWTGLSARVTEHLAQPFTHQAGITFL